MSNFLWRCVCIRILTNITYASGSPENGIRKCRWNGYLKFVLYSFLEYGCYTKGMDVIPKVQMLYQGYGCYTKGMDVIPKVWMLYQRYGCYT